MPFDELVDNPADMDGYLSTCGEWQRDATYRFNADNWDLPQYVYVYAHNDKDSHDLYNAAFGVDIGVGDDVTTHRTTRVVMRTFGMAVTSRLMPRLDTTPTPRLTPMVEAKPMLAATKEETLQTHDPLTQTSQVCLLPTRTPLLLDTTWRRRIPSIICSSMERATLALFSGTSSVGCTRLATQSAFPSASIDSLASQATQSLTRQVSRPGATAATRAFMATATSTTVNGALQVAARL
eukprot:SAG11_NODE_233_length_11903_cov_4.983650_4_plen_237_part_00